MDNRQLQIILKLQDQASAELRKISGEFSNAEKSASGWGGTLASIGKAAAVVASAIGAVAIGGAKWGIEVAAQLQTAEVGLQTLLGSSEKAAETVARLKVEAARTPFELPGLTQAVQLLTSVTKDGNKSIDIILDIGEGLAAMGKGQAELDRIIVNLQQIAAVGRAATIDIKQFAFAGIPIYEMLAETTGKTGQELQDLIENGGVTFDVLTEMFDKANDSGGRFFDAYKNNAGTFNQAMSNMKDSIGIFLADLVNETGLFDGLTQAMITSSNWLMNYKENVQSVQKTVSEWIQTLDENTGLVTLLKEAWDNIVDSFNTNLKPALMDLWETLKPYAPYVQELAKVFGFILVVAIGAVIKAIEGLVLLFIELRTWCAKINTVFYSVLKPAFDSIGETILAVYDSVVKLIDSFKSAWEWSQKVASATGNFVSGAVKSVGSAVSSVFRADGGHVSAGQPYVVGERGPEMFVPRSSGTIIPNGSGGMSVNVVVNGDVSGKELVDRVQEAIMMSLRANVKLAI